MMDHSSDVAAPLGEAQTCSHFIATVSAREMPDNNNVQMCILGVGFDCEGVVAEVLHHRICQRPRRVYCVVVPENVPPGSVARLAKAIERHLLTIQEKGGASHSHAVGVADGASSSATSSSAHNTPAVAVVAIEEGTGTKERCAAFQRGAVVLLTSRSLCADLLHRRLAVELVGAAILLLPHALLGAARVHDALAPQTAFCVELLLRNGKMNSAGLTNTERHAPPPIVVLSDAPMLMQSLVQRHHMGAERFVQQLHVGDIQLFPRFRLDFVRHFEALSRCGGPRGRPLEVDRVVAPVSPSVLALDGLLAKIVVETLQELQRLEQQQQQQRGSEVGGGLPGRGFGGRSISGGGGSHDWTPAARRAAAAADADEDVGALRFMPRARFTASTVNGHLDYSGYARSGASATTSTATAPGASSYVRRGWRAAKDEKGILFSGISEAAALAIDFSDLDSDLRAVVRRHESQWPFRLLTESLIDVRRLRRATRGTAYSFLLHLESVLEKRLPQRSVYGTGVRPPAALWTLSSHFNDVVTVATHRIGTVVFRPRESANPAVQSFASTCAGASAAAVVVVDSSDDTDEGEVGTVEKRAGAASTAAAAAVSSVPHLVPNTEEQETDVEVVVRLVMSWCRTTLRRRQSRSRHTAASTTGPTTKEVDRSAQPPSSAHTRKTTSSSPYPTLLLLTFGAGAVVRYTERLTHDREAYQQLQLRRFMQIYQAKYGVELQEYTAQLASAGDGELAAVEQQLRTTLFEADNPDDVYSEDEKDSAEGSGGSGATAEKADGDDARQGSGSTNRRWPLSQRGGASSQWSGVGTTAASSAPADASALYGEGSASAFHQALLTQMPPLATHPSTDGAGGRSSDSVLQNTTDTSAESGGGKSGSTATKAPALTLSVERVRAGAVTLQATWQRTHDTSASAALTEETADGGPRVLILDGGQLSATELTMLLDGSHEALSFSVPPHTSGPASDQGTMPGNADAAPERRLHVERVILSRQQLSILRQLEMAQDVLPASCVCGVKVQLITTTLAEIDFKKTVQAEQMAFESLAHTKATLTGTLLVDQSSLRQTEEALESGLQVARRRGIPRKGTAVARVNGRHYGEVGTDYAPPPCIIFDEREFRSTLPYDLYKRGMDLVPLTLTTADYILSPTYAVERKSLSDYLQSVMSGRIQHQFAALSRKYARPLCLVEFHRGIPFRMLQSRIYGRTARLMANYPRVCFLWARSPAHAAGMLVTLKKSVAVENVDPSDASLTGSAMDPGSAAEASGLAATAAEREAAHYAARVLSRFPGITHQNAPRVMQLCGSLIGLATISLASLATVMEEEDATRLHSFLHAPFHERVE